MSKILENDIWQEYINCYTSKNFYFLITLINDLSKLKHFSTEYEKRLKSCSKDELEKEMSLVIPHSASYNYILRYVFNPQLYKILRDSYVKIQKENVDLEVKFTYTDAEEFGLSVDLLSRVLLELDKLEFEDVIDLVSYIEESLFNRYDLEKRKVEEDFDNNKEIVFKGDLPISINNSKIFDNTFIVEQWMRRLVLFILMTNYGSKWIDAFNSKDIKDYEMMRKRLEESNILEFKDDNIIWYTTINFLSDFIKKKNIINIVEEITGISSLELSSALKDIKEVRNEMAHNRTITVDLENKFQSGFNCASGAIRSFKSKTIYRRSYNFLDFYTIDNSHNPIVRYFNKEDNRLWPQYKIQAAIKESDYCLEIVLLPCSIIKHEFIDIQKVLSEYKEFNNHIVAFYINKSGGEYQLLLPKMIIHDEEVIYINIVDKFFNIASIIGTDIAYELQDSKYTCNPKIWFYENDPGEGVKNLFFNNGDNI